jgi:hypothetical protein
MMLWDLHWSVDISCDDECVTALLSSNDWRGQQRSRLPFDPSASRFAFSHPGSPIWRRHRHSGHVVAQFVKNSFPHFLEPKVLEVLEDSVTSVICTWTPGTGMCFNFSNSYVYIETPYLDNILILLSSALLDPRNILFLSNFTTEILYKYLTFTVRATCSVNPSILSLKSNSFCVCIESPVTSPLGYTYVVDHKPTRFRLWQNLTCPGKSGT